MELTEFLLARIAEDEAVATESHTLGCASTDPCYTPPFPGPDYRLCDCPQRRVLAECEAKRRIVAQHQALVIDSDSTLCAYGALQTAAALAALALPYRDHPDFDPNWEA